jgi:hypothetical protein
MSSIDSFNVRFWFIADFLMFLAIASFWALVLGWLPGAVGVLRPVDPTTIHRVLGTGGVVLGGLLAFALRLWLRRVYGMAEVAFAVVVAWKTVGDVAQLSALQSSIVLAAAVYLVVRGLDNWLHGVEARTKES